MNAIYKKCFKVVPVVWGVSIAAALIINMIVITPQKERRERIRIRTGEKGGDAIG